jgi:hypothetical protein
MDLSTRVERALSGSRRAGDSSYLYCRKLKLILSLINGDRSHRFLLSKGVLY